MPSKVETLRPSTFETIDASVLEWVSNVLDIYATTNEGWKKVPVVWMTAERAFPAKDQCQVMFFQLTIIVKVLLQYQEE
jgi:hypothetical protein